MIDLTNKSDTPRYTGSDDGGLLFDGVEIEDHFPDLYWALQMISEFDGASDDAEGNAFFRRRVRNILFMLDGNPRV